MQAELTFHVESHTYRYGGRVVPSVTQVLRPIDNFDRVDPELLERARRFGSHAHQATDLFDRGELDEDSLDPGLSPHLAGYKLFLFETGFVVTHSEQQIYNPRQKYAGTLDKRGTWKGTTWLLDLKSGAIPRGVGLQTAGYQMACPDHDRPRKRLCLQLLPNNYKLIACDEPSDWSYFVSFLNTYRFMNRTTHASSQDETRAVA
jgi:hypothetical protein